MEISYDQKTILKEIEGLLNDLEYIYQSLFWCKSYGNGGEGDCYSIFGNNVNFKIIIEFNVGLDNLKPIIDSIKITYIKVNVINQTYGGSSQTKIEGRENLKTLNLRNFILKFINQE